jgi:hypothetical protein
MEKAQVVIKTENTSLCSISGMDHQFKQGFLRQKSGKGDFGNKSWNQS